MEAEPKAREKTLPRDDLSEALSVFRPTHEVNARTKPASRKHMRESRLATAWQVASCPHRNEWALNLLWMHQTEPPPNECTDPVSPRAETTTTLSERSDHQLTEQRCDSKKKARGVAPEKAVSRTPAL